jgi:hypothetical protein
VICMYQAHQADWLRVGFLVCLGLVATLAALAQFKKLKPPNYVFIMLFGLAVVQFMTMGWLRVSDNDRLRQELKDINPLSVTKLVVRADGGSRDIMLTNEVNMLFSQLQNVQAVHAHHSSPMSSYEVKFMLDSHEYQYRVARDSDRTDEYWVFETARAGNPGREIGRIHSPTLGKLLEVLVHVASPGHSWPRTWTKKSMCYEPNSYCKKCRSGAVRFFA